MSTTHNPTNFRPQDYEVYAYLDNNPFADGFFGMVGPEQAAILRAQHEADMEDGLGKEWRSRCWHCHHCGNGSVRYIAAVIHTPTGERVVFGSSCVARLNFKDEKQFQLARIKERDEANKVRLGAYLAREKFLEGKPELVQAIKDSEGMINTFLSDIKAKLNQWGNLSEKQVSAFIASVNRAKERAANPAPVVIAGDAPEGRATIEGKIVSSKSVEGAYGVQVKMLVILDNNSKVWGTAPAAIFDNSGIVGKRIELTATFTRKDGDKSFAFFKRPRGKILAPVVGAI